LEKKKTLSSKTRKERNSRSILVCIRKTDMQRRMENKHDINIVWLLIQDAMVDMREEWI
jgi:hypothetical protein